MGLLDITGGVRLRVKNGPDDIVGEGAGRNINEQQWIENCKDLWEVMSVCKNLYLFLEHSNEALLRVGIEIVTDRAARKCLWWTEGWMEDEGKHDYFRNVVKEKLRAALAWAKGSAVEMDDFAEKEPVEEDPRLAELKDKLERAEARAASAEQQQKLMEKRARELEENLDEARKKIREMQKTIDELTGQITKYQEDLSAKMEKEKPPPKDDSKDKLNDINSQLKKSEQEKQRLEAELEKLKEITKEIERWKDAIQVVNDWTKKTFAEPLDPSMGDTAKNMKPPEVEQVRTALENITKKIKDLKKEASKPPEKVEVVKEKPVEKPKPVEKKKKLEVKPVEVPPDVSGELKEALDALEVEKQRVRDLESQLAAMQDQLRFSQEALDAEKRKVEAAEKRAREAEERAKKWETEAGRLKGQLGQKPEKVIVKQTEEVKPPTPRGPDPNLMNELKELRAMKADYEKALETIKKLREINKKLRAENEELEARNDQLLKTLAQVREQLNRIMAIAEKKGLGKQVQEIMDEAGLTETLNSPEFTCFDRLYQDALRRQEKQREIERVKLGLVKKEREPKHAGILIRSHGGIVGYANDKEELMQWRAQQQQQQMQGGGAYNFVGGSAYHMDNRAESRGKAPGGYNMLHPTAYQVPQLPGIAGMPFVGGAPQLQASDFEVMDKDGDGVVSKAEFMAYLGSLGQDSSRSQNRRGISRSPTVNWADNGSPTTAANRGPVKRSGTQHSEIGGDTVGERRKASPSNERASSSDSGSPKRHGTTSPDGGRRVLIDPSPSFSPAHSAEKADVSAATPAGSTPAGSTPGAARGGTPVWARGNSPVQSRGGTPVQAYGGSPSGIRSASAIGGAAPGPQMQHSYSAGPMSGGFSPGMVRDDLPPVQRAKTSSPAGIWNGQGGRMMGTATFGELSNPMVDKSRDSPVFRRGAAGDALIGGSRERRPRANSRAMMRSNTEPAELPPLPGHDMASASTTAGSWGSGNSRAGHKVLHTHSGPGSMRGTMFASGSAGIPSRGSPSVQSMRGRDGSPEGPTRFVWRGTPSARGQPMIAPEFSVGSTKGSSYMPGGLAVGGFGGSRMGPSTPATLT